MLKAVLVPVFVLLLCAGLCGCAPGAIPFGASRHWDLEGGFTWTWTRRVAHGCAAWTAKDRWASVDLQIDPRCPVPRTLNDVIGAGINYFSSSDEIVFQGYWPRGEMYGGNPCPHQISVGQIAELRRVAAEALAQAKTEGERRVLMRIDERLSVVNGAALMTYHGGWCSDLTMHDWETARRAHVGPTREDVWQGGR